MSMEEVVVSDLAKFGARERKMLRELLQAWEDQGLPADFYDDEVKPCMNTNSGFVFLTNSDYQVAMMHGGELESFYSCPQCGEEGFWNDDIEAHGKDGGPECRRWVRDVRKGRKG